MKTSLVVFLASCATLVLELIAGRLLSPYIGSSLYTWTSIIGVVLAGISFGNWYGGKIADRYPYVRTVSVLLLLSGLSCFALLGFVALLGMGDLVRPVPLLARIFLLTTIGFFPASFLLGMITPVAIKLALPDVRHTGRVVGLIYALGTLGSLAGNFLTGFVLVAYLPVNTIVIAVGAALLVLALAVGDWRGAQRALARAEAAPAGPDAMAEVEPLSGTRTGLLRLAGNVPLACGVVVVASFCTMAIELAASRVLAPYIGVSLYSWTGIFGVVLAGIALGNYLGGRVADRWPSQQMLGAFLFLSGLASLFVLLAVRVVTQFEIFNELDLMARIVAMTAAIFFIPVLLLGMISPQVIKLAITDLSRAGRVSGRIYAWSTGGAILGTFLTGWLLISLMGVYPLILSAGLGLILLALLVGRFWEQPASLVAAVLLTGGTLYGLQVREALQSSCTRETNYFCIKVMDDTRDGRPVKVLVLDHLIHSYVEPGNPGYLGYEHEEVQAEITRLVASRAAEPNVLVIGGGGYTYPRWVEAFIPWASVEVVEIDPGVTETVYEDLDMPRDTKIVSHNLDGRQFVHELAPRDHYNLIVQDAVNDLSVPYHILTKEYNDDVRELLTEDGIYLLTIIDLWEDGQLLRSAVRTMMQTFPSVQLLGPGPIWMTRDSGVYVVAGSDQPINLEDVRRALQSQGVVDMTTSELAQEQLQAYVGLGPQIILTDQYAPVDNLISILFRERR